MKNISFLLMFIPLISFAQTYKYIGIELSLIHILPMGNNGSGRKSGGGGQIPEGGYRMQRYGASDGDSG